MDAKCYVVDELMFSSSHRQDYLSDLDSLVPWVIEQERNHKVTAITSPCLCAIFIPSFFRLIHLADENVTCRVATTLRRLVIFPQKKSLHFGDSIQYIKRVLFHKSYAETKYFTWYFSRQQLEIVFTLIVFADLWLYIWLQLFSLNCIRYLWM